MRYVPKYCELTHINTLLGLVWVVLGCILKSSQYFLTYHKNRLYTLMLTYPAGGLKVGLVFYLHPYFVCANSESSGESLKMHKLIGFVALAISDKISCTDTYIHVDLYKHTSSIWASGRYLILASVAHLRKRLS